MSRTITIAEESGTTLVGVSIAFKETPESSTNLILLGVGTGLSIQDASAGNWVIVVDPFTVPSITGNAFWSITTTDAAGAVKHYVSGLLPINNPFAPPPPPALCCQSPVPPCVCESSSEVAITIAQAVVSVTVTISS